MIVQAPNKILNSKAKNIIKFDSKIKNIAEQMFEVKEKKNAIGLAANQIGLDLNMAIIGYKKKKDEDPSIPELVLINPKLVWTSKEKQVDSEGCLSIPNEKIDVPRAKKIHLEYYDLEGKRRKLKAKGLTARVILHELDHLKGRKITDYK